MDGIDDISADRFLNFSSAKINPSNYEYAQIGLSILTTFIGAALVLLGFNDLLFKSFMILLGISSVLVAFGSLSSPKFQRRSSYYSLAFGVIVIGLAFLPNFLPESIELGFELEAEITRELLHPLLMIIFGLIGVTVSMKNIYNINKRASQTSAYIYLSYSVLLVIFILGILLAFVAVKGISSLSWSFLTQDISNLGASGGIFPAIIGTLLLGLGTTLMVVPFGVGTAIYLQEYARENSRIIRVVRTSTNILNGTPSIVHGLFAYALFVKVFGPSIISAILALVILTLPIVIRSSEEAINSVSDGLREASFALGATKWQTIKKAVLPSAIPGIVTGTVLGIGRALGETAPILFTGAVFTGAGVPQALTDKFHALSYHLYQLTQLIGYKDVSGRAWATAFVLIAIVLAVNFTAIIIREKYKGI